MIRVLLVDDQPAVRSGMRALLEPEADIEVVGEAQDGHAVIELARRREATIAVIDIRMPGMDGLDATRRLTASQDVRTEVLIVTTYDLDDYVFGALRAGAAGFLLKEAVPEELVPALRLIDAGHGLIDPTVTRRLISEYAAISPPPTPDETIDALTPRELDVLKLIARGLSNAQVAETLEVEESTVKSHVTAMLAKLELHSRVQAVIYAYEQGVVRINRGSTPYSKDAFR